MFDNAAEFDPALHDWSNDADVEIPEDFPRPLLWRVLIVPRRPKTKTKSGLLIAQAAQDAEKHLNYVGQIVAMGSLAFKSDLFKDMGDTPGPGDWVIYGRYAGQPMLYKGVRFLICDDKQLMCRVANSDGLTVYI